MRMERRAPRNSEKDQKLPQKLPPVLALPDWGAGDWSSLRPRLGFQACVLPCLAPNCPHSK